MPDIPDIDAEWTRLRERLLAFVRRRVRDGADAEDLLHDVFVRMQRGVDDLDDARRFDAWLFRIARNAIIDYYRAKDRRRDAMDAFRADPSDAVSWHAGGQPDQPDQPDQQARRELSQCVAPFVERMPEAYRQALELTDLGELSQAEAARRLGLSVSGMKSRVQRGRAHLKGLLLECCRLELDHRGGVMGVEAPRSCHCGGPDA